MSFNSTATPSAYDSLYLGTDYLSLNWFEQQWVSWYVAIGNPALATGIASFMLHEVLLLRASKAYFC
jgi:methylsterol monooxygenase